MLPAIGDVSVAVVAQWRDHGRDGALQADAGRSSVEAERTVDLQNIFGLIQKIGSVCSFFVQLIQNIGSVCS